jgi:hypothetical protein
VAGYCECGDEPSGYCASELVSYVVFVLILNIYMYYIQFILKGLLF